MTKTDNPKDPLTLAIEQEQNCREVLYLQPSPPTFVINSEGSVHLAFKNALTANNYVTILRALPKYLADHNQLTDVVTELIGIVALQQAQIRNLNERLEHTMHARVAVQAQKDAYENVQTTIARGSNIGKQEITVSVRAVAESERSRSTTADHCSGSSNEQSSEASASDHVVSDLSGELAGDVKGLLRAVAGLKLSGKLRLKIDQANETEQSSKSKAVARVRTLEKHEARESRRSDFAGTMTLKVENITGDPMVQAKADAIRSRLLDDALPKSTAATANPQPPPSKRKKR